MANKDGLALILIVLAMLLIARRQYWDVVVAILAALADATSDSTRGDR